MSLPIVYHPDYVTPLPDAHRFPMPKFRLLYELLLSDGVADLNQFISKVSVLIKIKET